MSLKIAHLFFFFYSLISLGQNTNYIILSFEYKIKNIKQVHYWVTESDSIDDYSKLNLKQLIINKEYSTIHLNNCCSGNKLSFIEDDKNVSDFLSFSDAKLKKHINRNKTFLQKIIHKYGSGLKSKLKVYATPILGNLCQCMALDQQTFGIIIDYIPTYIPKSDFTLNESFKKTNNWKRLRHYDFSEYIYENFH